MPPGIPPETWWRLVVSSSICGGLIFAMWAVGMFAAMGATGFARADEQAKILAELHDQKIERLEGAILAAQRDYCSSAAGTKPRQFYLERRNMKLNEYQAVTGHSYSGLPNCDEL